MGLSDAVESVGFKSLGIRISQEKINEAPLPCILHWNSNHFVVLYKIKKDAYYISDPAHGLIMLNQKEFLSQWIGPNASETTRRGHRIDCRTHCQFL